MGPDDHLPGGAPPGGTLADGEPPPFAWKRTWVDERPALYGVVGEGLPVVFLHGWALGRRSYRHAIGRLVDLGCRVYAPNLPGFGRTPELPSRSFSFAGYAVWVHDFLDALKITEPVFLVGHSFGGGVAIKVAHQRPDRVRTLVLVNSVGGSTWSSAGGLRAITERPLWDWGLHFPTDIWPIPQATKVLPVVLEEAVPNLIRNPRAVWRVGQLARRADLTPELEDLKARALPVVLLWGTRDGVIPRAAFDAMCSALGSEGEVVEGSHSWLLADPDHFGEVITNHVEVAQLAREMERHPTRPRRRLELPTLRRR
jgi:pimeloyl-ACP methyl ester carboxylesterase